MGEPDKSQLFQSKWPPSRIHHDHRIQLLASHRACAANDGTLTGKMVPVEVGLNDFRDGIELGSLSTLDNRNADTHYFLPAGRTAEKRPQGYVTHIRESNGGLDHGNMVYNFMLAYIWMRQ